MFKFILLTAVVLKLRHNIFCLHYKYFFEKNAFNILTDLYIILTSCLKIAIE
mgnify:CR=1 FL=1